jgi:hypothetical protein
LVFSFQEAGMRTPFGSECKYFYGDYYRGRNHEECRLLENRWRRELCKNCPVPGILRANACEHMRLTGRVTRGLTTLFRQRVEVSAYCERTDRAVAEPHVGCGECHPLPPVFTPGP